MTSSNTSSESPIGPTRSIPDGARAPTGQEAVHPDSSGRGSAGEHEFDAFFKGNYAFVLKFLVLIGASWAEAEDAAQEAMLAVLQAWPKITNHRQWLLVAARRRLVRSQQRSRRQIPLIAEGGWLSELEGGPVPEAAVTEQAVDQDLLRLVADLPPRQRQIIALVADGYSQAEVAEALGLTPSAVRANLYKARRNLKGPVNTTRLGR